MKLILLAVTLCFALSAPCLCQCNTGSSPWSPSNNQQPVDAGEEQTILDAIYLAMCCAQVTGNPLLQSACENLLSMVEAGDRFYFDFSPDVQDSMAVTQADFVCGSTRVFTSGSPPDNSIAFSSSQWPTMFTAGSASGNAILAGVLIHEYCHAVTLDNALDGAGVWDDLCGLWENEIQCYIIEESVLDCIVLCGCAGTLEEGELEAIQARKATVHSLRQSFLQNYEDC